MFRAAKRQRLPPVSYQTLTELEKKSPEEVITAMLERNFRLEDFLKDQRMQENYDWMYSMTVLLEKITYCHEWRGRFIDIFEKILDTSYLKGVCEEIGKFDPSTKQFRFKFIQLFLQICKTFLEIIPHSFARLTLIVERIALRLIENQSNSTVRINKEEFF